jgi:YVTN family beta-propeller protein
MSRRDASGPGSSLARRLRTSRGLRTSRRVRTYGAPIAAAAVLIAAATAIHAGISPSAANPHAAKPGAAKPGARLAASSCNGPAGAAYVADAGWDGFSAINTANCKIIQTYNVGDPQVPGDAGDYNYASTDEGVAIHGSTLYFADTGTSNVAVIDTATLDPSNYNPDETLINVGLNPQDLAVTPDGSQVWVADTGPQTSPSSPSGVSVISTATNKVIASMHISGGPSQVAFSPDGATAYVVTADGLYIYRTASRQQVGLVRGLGDPRSVAVSPDGRTVYVTDTVASTVAVINAATGRITSQIKVGQMPWQAVISADGRTVYVADADSNAVSIINTAANKVSDTVTIPGDPDTLALTPNGQQLWVGQNTAAFVTVLDTASKTIVGTINLGGDEPQSGDGYEPTGIALTTTPTPGS